MDLQNETSLPPLYYSEDPLDNESADLFHHSAIVDTLVHAIIRSQGSINISLYGGWGVGKSTIINFLKNRIEKEDYLKDEYQLIIIDAWRLNPDILRQELLEDLALLLNISKIEREKIHDSLYNIQEVYDTLKISKKAKILNYIKKFVPLYPIPGIFLGFYYLGKLTNQDLFPESFLGAITVPVLIGVVQLFYQISKNTKIQAKRIIRQTESSQKFQDIFEKLLQAKKKPKLIIAIDNLDRCDAKSVVKILGSIKTFMGNPNCIYIMPCDEQALINHLKHEFKIGKDTQKQPKEFLRKFFQITLHIPPQIRGDIDTYVKNNLERFSEIEIDDFVNEVFISGTSQNPRKLRQFLYNFAILFKLAKIREGVTLRDKIITKNTGFLAKLVVIREEWPDFYEILETWSTLWESIQNLLTGQPLQTGDSGLAEKIQKIFDDNTGLEHFLRATILVTTNDIQPFLKLSQETYASSISELDEFTQKVRQNEIDYVKSEFKKLSPQEIETRIHHMLDLIDTYTQNSNFQFAFNIINVLLEIYNDIPDKLQHEVISNFSTYIVTTQEIKNNIHKFSAEKLFPIILQMEDNSRDVLLKQYCRNMENFHSKDDPVLKQFIINATVFSNDVLSSFDEHFSKLGKQNTEDFLQTIDILSSDPNTKNNLIGNKTINSLIDRIDLNESSDNQEIVKKYLALHNIASNENKLLFVKKMISAIKGQASVAIVPIHQWAIGNLASLANADLNSEMGNLIFNELKDLITQYADINHKKIVIVLILRSFSHLSEENKDIFIEKYFTNIIPAMSLAHITEICQISKDNNANILEYDVIIDNLIAQFNKVSFNDEILSYLIENCKGENKEKIVTFIVNQLNGKKIPLINIIATNLKKTFIFLPKPSLENICTSWLNVAPQIPWNQVYPSYEAISLFIDKCSNKSKEQFIVNVFNWMNTVIAQKNPNIISEPIIQAITKIISNEKRDELATLLLNLIEIKPNSTVLGACNDTLKKIKGRVSDSLKDQIKDLENE